MGLEEESRGQKESRGVSISIPRIFIQLMLAARKLITNLMLMIKRKNMAETSKCSENIVRELVRYSIFRYNLV